MRLALILAGLLAACSARTDPYAIAERPAEPAYGAALPAGTTAWSNDSLAEAFTMLMHRSEWGGSVPYLLRYETPVRVNLVGDGANQYAPFTRAFLADIRRHAGIDIRLSEVPGNLRIEFVPGYDFEDFTANQCFFVSGLTDWETFLSDPERFSWARPEAQERLTGITVFLPQTHPPHAVRGCIAEEVTQALGPGNDLYGLAWSIFNDDEGHIWPTAVDYLMLRLLYHPDLHTGLRPRETRARARALLEVLNPEGESARPLPAIRQARFQSWRDRLHATAARDSDADYSAAEMQALVREAERVAPGSNYACHAAMRLADERVVTEATDALATVIAAEQTCRKAHAEDDIRLAQIRLMRMIALIDRADWTAALDAGQGLPEVFLAHGQEANAVMAYGLTYAALGWLDRTEESEQVLRHAIDWGAYAFGDDSSLIEEWRLF